MVSYFMKMRAEDPDFFHVERIDETDRLKDVMWVDARSRDAYREFSDVVCFDTTYLTNKFKLIFGNFVGVNHHGQSTLFGCALLSHEDSETFEWLFSTWLECMEGRKPGGFFTDQCAAIRKALKVVMPESRHRWCLWHILNKFHAKLGCYAKYDEFKDVLNNIIYDSLTESVFETDWETAIQKYNLQDCDWLAGLFSKRQMWVPAYMKHIFWVVMKTTQRSESINSFFDNYVQRQTTLHEFAPQYFTAIEARTDAEEQAEADCERNKLTPVTDFRIETEFQNLNQRKIADFLIELTVLDHVYYRDKNLRKDCSTKKVCQYTVTLDERTKDAWCSCKMLECHGIMCRHLISVFDALMIRKLPAMLILDRWRKDIERPYMKIKVKYHNDKTEVVLRIDRIQLVFDDAALLAAENEDDTKGLIDIMQPYMGDLTAERAKELSSKEGDNAHLPILERAASDADMSTQGSKEGENTPLVQGNTAQYTPQPATNKKRPIPVDKDTTPSVKKPSTSHQCNITPGAAESVVPCGRLTGEQIESQEQDKTTFSSFEESLGGRTDSLGTEVPPVVKDPTLPINSRGWPIESWYKSAVELNTTGKGKGKITAAATPKPRKLTAKQQLVECTFQLQQQQQALLAIQASMQAATFQQQVQQQQQQHLSSLSWMNFGNYSVGGIQSVGRPLIPLNLPPPQIPAPCGTSTLAAIHTSPCTGALAATRSPLIHTSPSLGGIQSPFGGVHLGLAPNRPFTHDSPSFGGIGIPQRNALGEMNLSQPMKRGRRSPVQVVSLWVRRQPPKVKAFLSVVVGMAALVFLRMVVHDHDILFVADEAVHAICIAVLIYKLTREKTCAGFHGFCELSCPPNLITYNIVLDAFCKAGDLSRVREVWSEMKRKGMEFNQHSYSLMVDALVTGGEVIEACNMLEEMLSKSFLPLSSTVDKILYCLCHEGLILEALQTLKLVSGRGVSPGTESWEALLCALDLNQDHVDSVLGNRHFLGNRQRDLLNFHQW